MVKKVAQACSDLSLKLAAWPLSCAEATPEPPSCWGCAFPSPSWRLKPGLEAKRGGARGNERHAGFRVPRPGLQRVSRVSGQTLPSDVILCPSKDTESYLQEGCYCLPTSVSPIVTRRLMAMPSPRHTLNTAPALSDPGEPLATRHHLLPGAGEEQRPGVRGQERSVLVT